MTLIGDWDPDILFNPIQPKVLEIDPLIPLILARAMAVKVQTISLGCGNCFLDDIIKTFLAYLSITKKMQLLFP